MRLPTILPLLGLLAAAPPGRNGRYYGYSSLGPHSWNLSVRLRGSAYSSHEWRTGFFDWNDQLTVGTIRQQGNTLLLVPQRIVFYEHGLPVKNKGYTYHRRRCACRVLLADTARLPDLRANNRKKLNQQLCRQGYRLLVVGDSLIQLRSSDGHQQTGLRRLPATGGR